MTGNGRITRRRFIDLALGATAATALGSACARTQPTTSSGEAMDVTDVAIVGGGLAGMSAARELSRRGVENFVVFEARDRVGGRTFNHQLGEGYVAEGGGQWVGPTQTAILELCRDLGVETFSTHLAGKAQVRLRGQTMKLPKDLVLTPPTAFQLRLDELARRVPLEAPWNAREAGEWDRMTVAQGARAHGATASDLDGLRRIVALDLASTPESVSFLYFLYYVHSAGGIEMLESFEGGAQTSRIVGGSQILSLKIAESLGERLRLRSPVSRISQDDRGVTIETLDGSLRAHYVIMAVMPSLCAEIGFTPPLPPARASLQERWKARPTSIKFNVVYEKPFWRDNNLSGLSFSDEGPTPFTADNSPPGGGIGVLQILSERNVHPSDPELRREYVLNSLVGLFGESARRPTGFYELDWSAETYTGACVSPLAPGVLTRYGVAMRGSFGRIHWSGTEAAERWTGAMDGAVRAGQTSARAVAAAIGA